MINKFVRKTFEELDKKLQKQRFVGEIFDEIQEELGQNTQLPTFCFNNNTRYIKFCRNTCNSKSDDVKLEVELGKIGVDL